MFRNAFRYLSILLIYFILTEFDLSAQITSSIIIQTDKKAISASTMLNGIFVEDYTHAVEGGIYAEMIRNRSFDDTKSSKEVLVDGFAIQLPDTVTSSGILIIPSWTLVSQDANGLKWCIDQSNPLNINNVRCLRLDASNLIGKNGVYNITSANQPGFVIKSGESYQFSFYVRIKQPDSNAGLTVSLESAVGTTILSKTVTGIGTDWQKIQFEFNPAVTQEGVRLFISPIKAGTYYMDMVSLFPKSTWNNRPNGLRSDIMDKVAALKPAFVRFPGGCFVEGLGVVNSWKWKKTIGPIEQRPGHWNIWGWRSSDGMGYHEYLQMCTDLNAEPLLVINDGISHDINSAYNGVHEFVPMANMDTLVQDALDAIEYAKGSVTSTWGAKRAANGHPEPFKLNYIEVGNENNGLAGYDERYALFYDSIRAHYPEIKIIYDGTAFPANRVPDLTDSHRFALPFWYADAYTMYDSYDRSKPKVYFGEWSVQNDPNVDNLQTGLYEGIFVLGLEKNSDIVAMQSYAPFISNTDWHSSTNMLNLNTKTLYGRPTYYIQKLISENRIDSILKFTSSSPAYRPIKSGLVGVGTNDTQSQFRDFVVTNSNGTVLFDGNSSQKSNWTISSGMTFASGLFTQTGSGSQSAKTKTAFSGDYTITLKAMKTGGTNGFLVYFQTDNYWQVGGDSNKASKMLGPSINSMGYVSTVIQNNVWYDLKIEIKGDTAYGYLNGVLTNRAYYRPLQTLYVSSGKNSNQDVVLKVINISGTDQSTHIQAPGILLNSECVTTTISSNDPTIKNTLNAPENVLPQTKTITNVSNDFNYTFPAYSVSVLILKKRTTFVDETDSNSLAVSIMENPVKQLLKLKNADNTSVSILNLTGCELIKSTYHHGIDVSNLAKGIYFVKSQANHKSITLKFIKE